MHALRKYIQGEMDRRGWKAADLVLASGIAKQVVSSLLNDDRDRIDRMPTDRTIDGLAKAFSTSREVILNRVADAMGLPVDEPVIVYDARRVPNEELLRELERRLQEGGGEHVRSAPMSGPSPAGAAGRLSVVPDAGDTSKPEEGLGDEPPPFKHPADHEWTAEVQDALDEQAKAARRGTPAHPPDITTGEESQAPPDGEDWA